MRYNVLFHFFPSICNLHLEQRIEPTTKEQCEVPLKNELFFLSSCYQRMHDPLLFIYHLKNSKKILNFNII